MKLWRAEILAIVVSALLFTNIAAASRNDYHQESAMDYSEGSKGIANAEDLLHGHSVPSSIELKEFVSGKSESSRRDIYALYWRTGKSLQEKPALRKAILGAMLMQVSSETPLLRGQLLKWLLDFHSEDFDEDTRKLALKLPWTPEFTPEAIRLIGVAKAKEAIPLLQEQIGKNPLGEPPTDGYYAGNTWAALLALARMGDAAALGHIIQRVRNEKDIILRATVLFGDLGFTRGPTAFEALRFYVNSDARLPQIKSNVPGQLEAAYAAAEFAKYVQGFPIQDPEMSEKEVSQARMWINAQRTFHIREDSL